MYHQNTLLSELTTQGKTEIVNQLLYTLEYYRDYPADLHNAAFNSDYFIIGSYQAEQWIINHFGSVWSAIDAVQSYEEENFGQVNTIISEAESTLNMLVYIMGEELLQDSDHLSSIWDQDNLTPLDAEIIKQEILSTHDECFLDPIYQFAITYQISTPESVEQGDYHDTGYHLEESQDTQYASLIDLLNDTDIQNQSWLEFSSDPVDGNNFWVISDVDSGTREYFEKGHEVSYNLHITRIDKKPLTRSELELIHHHLTLIGKFRHMEDTQS